MVDPDLIRPTVPGLLGALRLHVSEGFAAWRAAWRMRAELRRMVRERRRRLRAELDSMSLAERLELDIIRGNAALNAKACPGT